MSQSEDFFSDLKEWSVRKLNIIQNYLNGFSIILGSKHNEIYYVDGFAGRGMYDGGEKGSPVLAAEKSFEFQQSHKPFILKCINVEKDHDNFKNLVAETHGFGPIVTNYEGTFEERIDTILAQTNSKPAVFFLDDFGVKGTGWDTVEKVIARKGPTDVWIRFDHKTVRRLAGFYESAAKETQGKLNTLGNLFGIRDHDYLRARLETGATPDERKNNALTLYIERLEQTFEYFGENGFAAAYPIISLDGQSKYHLIFACSNSKAATLASNVVNGVEETFQREKEKYKESKAMQLSLFPREITEAEIMGQKVDMLKKLILSLPKAEKITRELLHYRLLRTNKDLFGIIGRKHLTRALKGLLDEKPPRITCAGTPGSDNAIITILEQIC